MLPAKQLNERPSRMNLIADVILLRQGESWYTEVIDISASGILVERPANWLANSNEQFGIELILSNGNTISLSGTVARFNQEEVAFAFDHIPPHSEVPFWSLLGQYADSIDLPR